MFELSDQDISFIWDHLHQESRFLDFMLVRSQQVRDHLESSSPMAASQGQPAEKQLGDAQPPDAGTSSSRPDAHAGAIPAEKSVEELSEFAGLVDGRMRLKRLCQGLSCQGGDPLTLRQLIQLLPVEHQAKLHDLRTSLKHKVRQIQIVNSGTQTILTYTLNYYESYLNGLSNHDGPDNRYSSSGTRMRLASNILRTNC